ncbi:tyrosine-type recombinase/integrase [Methanolobus mangrovi]|uniref:Tyrosine-type recombinase/integrase n=1 Tax=Methanolobus mangrovi TaxID=3072977 RepID=A0AA51UIG8_9EURY|nr:tyrosine-type recombinase/integrase [Methanolobus mangrovi]WMW22732.1 tyrosine-type recombinase/integrase [Methanolobus mangrovi]
MELYDYNKKIANAENLILNSPYSEKNKELIFEFVNVLYAEGISTARVLKYLSSLHNLSKWFNKPFPEITKTDVYKLVGDLERSDRSVWTKRDYRVVLKRFFRWMNNDKDPEITAWISTNVKQKDRKMPEELLTEEEVKKMLEVAEHPRDAAIVAVWYDSGGRVGENGTRSIKHIGFDQYGSYEIVKGKTGMRRVRLVMSTPYIAAWLSIHPMKNDPEAPLWVNIGRHSHGKPMKYDAIRMVLKRLAKKAGIKKRVYPHLFRHTRATELANHLTQAQMESHLGWIHGSDMPGTYIHLSGQQVDDAILSIYGLVKDEDRKPILTSVNCPRCKTMNGPTSDFCCSCGMALNASAATNIDDMQQLGMQLLLEIGAKDPKDVRELQGYLGKLKEVLSDNSSASISDE